MASEEKSLVIVESPAKARTISDFLPKSFKVEASVGHIRDLPKGAKEVPKKYKSESWSRLGIDVDNDFEPLYIVPAEKKKQVQKLKAALKDVDHLYLATDEDREGESISWHLMQVLKPEVPLRRLVSFTRSPARRSWRRWTIRAISTKAWSRLRRRAADSRSAVRLRGVARPVAQDRPPGLGPRDARSPLRCG